MNQKDIQFFLIILLINAKYKSNFRLIVLLFCDVE